MQLTRWRPERTEASAHAESSARDQGWRDAARTGAVPRRGALVVAAVLAAAGTLGMFRAARAAAPVAPVGAPTVVVSSEVPAGARGDALVVHLELADVPASARPSDALGSIAEVDGAAARDLAVGQVLRQADLARGADAPRLGVGGTEVPAGALEVSLSLEPQRALGGRLVAGSSVLVVGTGSESSPAGKVAGPVTVTAVAEPAAPGDDVVVTLAVAEADLAPLAAEAAAGRVWLAGVPR